jgi:putative PIN family toxin of toxin-antitoxin system
LRVVLDTNVVISGLLWLGSPRRVLDLARQNRIQLFTSLTLIAELDAVLRRSKFAQRLGAVGVSPATLIVGYASLAHVLQSPSPLPQRICRDPADDHVLACARAARAELIVSGDNDLLAIKRFLGIAISHAADALALIQAGPP